MTTKAEPESESATEKLARIVRAELVAQNRAGEEVAREARLPSRVFQALQKGRSPSLDRADAICKAVGISITIGTNDPSQASSRH